MEAKTSSELQAVETDDRILYGHRRDNLRNQDGSERDLH
jgi:hypothetical protein